MKPFNKILIATDGSESSKIAAAKGIELAKIINSEVTAMSVIDLGGLAYAEQGPDIPPKYNIMPIYQYLKEGAEAAVDQVRKAGEAENIDVRTIVEEGAPADEIIKASKAYDLIVMGTLGRTGLSHLLMGSVAEKVVRFAHCPVMVIRTVESTEGP